MARPRRRRGRSSIPLRVLLPMPVRQDVPGLQPLLRRRAGTPVRKQGVGAPQSRQRDHERGRDDHRTFPVEWRLRHTAPRLPGEPGRTGTCVRVSVRGGRGANGHGPHRKDVGDRTRRRPARSHGRRQSDGERTADLDGHRGAGDHGFFRTGRAYDDVRGLRSRCRRGECGPGHLRARRHPAWRRSSGHLLPPWASGARNPSSEHRPGSGSRVVPRHRTRTRPRLEGAGNSRNRVGPPGAPGRGRDLHGVGIPRKPADVRPAVITEAEIDTALAALDTVLGDMEKKFGIEEMRS